jgi:DNA-binding transcriptional LysR family regulator
VAYVLGATPGKWAGIWRTRKSRHPIELVTMSPAEALSALEQGGAQVALMRLPVDSARFAAIPLYDETPVAIAEREHPIAAFETLTMVDLAGETLLEGDWAEIVELVAAGVGIAMLPKSVARALSRRDVIARDVVDAPPTRMALVWPVDGTTDDVNEFIGIVRGRTTNSSRG